MGDPRLYDRISSTYRTARVPDRRIAAQVHAALGDARRVVNVGAGTGNYEPTDRAVVAVEPSRAMLERRPAGAAPAVQGVAEDLPFRDGAFDAAMATLTLHHWEDRERGLTELRRVAARQVIFLFDPSAADLPWVVRYWPEARSLPSERAALGPQELEAHLRITAVEPVPIPIDCTDGFGAAFWGRPEAYLDPELQQGMSWLAQLPPDVLAAGARRLEAALASGAWDAELGHLRSLDVLDVGYRLVVAEG